MSSPDDCTCAQTECGCNETGPGAPMILVPMPLDVAEGLWDILQGSAEWLDELVIGLIGNGGDQGATEKAAADYGLVQAAADCLHDALEGDANTLDTIDLTGIGVSCECAAEALTTMAGSFAKLADLHIGLIERIGGAT